MPSYRVSLTIGELRPGVDPQSVMPSAAAVAAELTTVEGSSVDLMRGVPRVTVRFTADDDEIAAQVAGAVEARTQGSAEVIEARITCLRGGRWLAVHVGKPKEWS